MPVAHINIGSNLGDSRAILERAVAGIFCLHESDGCQDVMPELCGTMVDMALLPRYSSFVESEPWGYESVNRFVNVGVEIVSTLPPLELLHALAVIEGTVAREFVVDADMADGTTDRGLSHRKADGAYADRLLDIDMILYGSYRLSTPELTLPHPRAILRRFVTDPLLELHPDFDLSMLK